LSFCFLGVFGANLFIYGGVFLKLKENFLGVLGVFKKLYIMALSLHPPYV
jgi:hypothetical protein